MKAVLIAFSFALSLAAQAASPAADGSPRFVVNLLDYVAADYGGAVSGGKVTSPSEYQEQIEFTQSAIASLRTLPREPAQAKTLAQLEGRMALLLKRIQAKADATEIAALAQQIKQGVIQATGLPVAPQRWPNLKQGARIFAQNCTTCHGPTGHGDGPAGKGLDPAPADFHDASMAEKTPFRAYNVIRVGVPGTGMVAWNTLSDQDAWDVAFYVMSMRYGREPREIQGSSPFLLETLATTSDQELLKEFKGSDDERREQLVALRLTSGSDGGGSSLALARSKLDEALVEYRAGKHDSAKQSSLAAYL
ncbi:MAG TPA: cytochrome c, partial [Bdellovibrionota bacterium]|nr:cytochrome c [Bdellovibrionota bacterium]